MGGLLDATTPSDTIVQFLLDGQDGFTWSLATVGANNAAGYQLATGNPVMAIGGFNGTDQWPTLEGFQQMVADGDMVLTFQQAWSDDWSLEGLPAGVTTCHSRAMGSRCC